VPLDALRPSEIAASGPGPVINRGADGNILLPTMLDLEASVRRRFTKAVRSVQAMSAFKGETTDEGAPAGAGAGSGNSTSWVGYRDNNAEINASRSKRATAMGLSMPMTGEGEGAGAKAKADNLPKFSSIETAIETAAAGGVQGHLRKDGNRKGSAGPRISKVAPNRAKNARKAPTIDILGEVSAPAGNKAGSAIVLPRKVSTGPRISTVFGKPGASADKVQK